jgi:hypothetical protein
MYRALGEITSELVFWVVILWRRPMVSYLPRYVIVIFVGAVSRTIHSAIISVTGGNAFQFLEKRCFPPVPTNGKDRSLA